MEITSHNSFKLHKCCLEHQMFLLCFAIAVEQKLCHQNCPSLQCQDKHQHCACLFSKFGTDLCTRFVNSSAHITVTSHFVFMRSMCSLAPTNNTMFSRCLSTVEEYSTSLYAFHVVICHGCCFIGIGIFCSRVFHSQG